MGIFIMNANFLLKDVCNTYTDYSSIKSAKSNCRIFFNYSKVIDFDKMISMEKFLHEDEYEYFKTLKYKRRINSFLLGRYSAKRAISALAGEENLKKILIKNGVFNQPVVICETGSNIQVSLTHCDDFAVAVAFNDMLILGIDIEKTNQRINAGVEAELTQYEKELAYSVSYSYEIFLLMIWTMKEALSKVLKTGLTIPLNILEVKNIERQDGYFVSTYTNFFQYKAITFIVEDYVYSLTYPKSIEIDVSRIKRSLHEMITRGDTVFL